MRTPLIWHIGQARVGEKDFRCQRAKSICKTYRRRTEAVEEKGKKIELGKEEQEEETEKDGKEKEN